MNNISMYIYYIHYVYIIHCTWYNNGYFKIRQYIELCNIFKLNDINEQLGGSVLTCDS